MNSALYACMKHVMSKPLITIDSKASAHEAISLMVEKEIGAWVMTEKEKPVGIVTERDILRNCCPDIKCANTKVKELMSEPPIAVDAESAIGATIEIMTNGNMHAELRSAG